MAGKYIQHEGVVRDTARRVVKHPMPADASDEANEAIRITAQVVNLAKNNKKVAAGALTEWESTRSGTSSMQESRMLVARGMKKSMRPWWTHSAPPSPIIFVHLPTETLPLTRRVPWTRPSGAGRRRRRLHHRNRGRPVQEPREVRPRLHRPPDQGKRRQGKERYPQAVREEVERRGRPQRVPRHAEGDLEPDGVGHKSRQERL